ncbi:EscU/YscU/HrcU family type III secretion system export apparatus switch protein [Pseudotabrizicola algicola]|uniref:EscU/YscU/HrcU family type III secretion system export apparatus switch protein n=1 Tax=Pseudotabrizicola algicola TaxID=2709381 RepID=A0A6B3RGW6_9RHOB|nr:EscU/YscU/HrcU family type III secretion system export apparatus switch protein [Pseudotabrizicola algicola]NEX45277.1 EscU/YscU/HrcU family type III secretion system export apparatus switch protein [Pseudotabrizicola algicola]
MAENDDGAERSHEPTQKRLDEARREGRVLTSKEMMVFVTMAAGTLVIAASPLAGTYVAARWSSHLRLGPPETLDAALFSALGTAGFEVMAAALAVAVPVMLAAILAQAAMGGLGWSAKGYAFKPEKLDPMKGLGRMVSLTALVELGKALAKVGLLLSVTFWVVYDAMPEIVVLGDMPTGDAAKLFANLAFRLFAAMTLVLGLIGIADLLWQSHKMQQSLRMTFDEVKRESREDNGSPEVKGRLRRMQIEASQRGSRERAALAHVPTASAVITNPTHFAVAVRYTAGVDEAPTIIATGRDQMARQVIERARKAGVPILGLPPLARALYFTGEIGSQIHVGLYGAVAAVLAHIWRIERGLREDLPEIDLPEDLQFDALGHRAR